MAATGHKARLGRGADGTRAPRTARRLEGGAVRVRRMAAALRGAGGAALGRGLAGLEHDRLECREGDGGAQGAVQERWASGV